jgi:hypothetical protein
MKESVMIQRKAKPPQQKPPILPPWLAAALAFALPKLLGGVLYKVGIALAVLLGLPGG